MSSRQWALGQNEYIEMIAYKLVLLNHYRTACLLTKSLTHHRQSSKNYFLYIISIYLIYIYFPIPYWT